MYRLSFALIAVAAPACSQPAPDTPRAEVARVETRGLDPATMASTVAAAERLPRLHSMVIARHGRTIAEHRFRGPSLDTPVNIKSASKTILATLTGIAIERR
jgi:CubicO group peptidase (beta-lactamase class C family)